MKTIDMDKLERVINSSDALSAVVNDIEGAINKELGDNNVGIDPFLILMLISVIIQVVKLCRERNKQTDDSVIHALMSLNNLPLRRTIVLRRRINTLWVEHCRKHNISTTAPNPLLAALRGVSTKMPLDAAKEFVALSKTL